MKSSPVAVFLLAVLVFCHTLPAQQPVGGATEQLNNNSVIKLIKAGLSDDLVVSTIKSVPGAYDISAEGLIALKTAGASDKIISAIVLKTSSAPLAANPPAPPVAEAATTPADQPAQKPFLPAPSGEIASYAAKLPARTASAPRVYLQSASKGRNRNAARDQSMEMSKDLEKDCPAVRVTINQQVADYTVLLNHIESGFVRDNQIQVANKDGDLISKTKEGGSIAGGLKKACTLILADWDKK
jgi:hypothetical protein